MPFRSTFATSFIPVSVAALAAFTWGTLRPDIESRVYFSITFGVFGAAVAYVSYRVREIGADARKHREKLEEQVNRMRATVEGNRRELRDD